MVCTVNSIDSNVTGLSIAEEECPKTLPATPKWFAMEPNSYPAFGPTIKTVAREPINPLRQNKRGSVVDLEAAGGFSSDKTQNNFVNLLQGFFVNDAYEKYNLHPMGLTATQNPCTSVAGSGVYNVTSTLASLIRIGDLVKTTGFASSANNALGKVTNVVTTALTTNISTVVDASPASDSNIRVVGFEFASGDLVATVSSGTLILTSSAKTMTELGLRVGEWIYIGGDTAGTQFANGKGYARVKTITATTIVCDKSTGLVSADAGTGKTVRIFTGTYIRNATQESEIIFRTYQLERTLGEDANGTQSEYLTGSYPNEFSLKLPSASKLEADLNYVAMNYETRDGTTGVKSGTRIAALGEDAYNTSTSVVRVSLALVEASLTPTALVSFLKELNFNINNGVKLNKAVGVTGGSGVSTGNFVVSGAITAYFQTIAAQAAIRNNSDVALDAIFARNNAGFVIDVPLLTLGGGNTAVVLNEAITLPLDNFAAQNANNYTASYTNFSYLPTVAMPA